MPYQEGQTATNPQTGEKVIFRGGAWQPVSGGGNNFPGIIAAPPKPIDPYKERDQQLQESAAARAAASDALAQEKAARERLEWTATHNPDGTPKAKVVSEKPLPAWAANPYEQQIGILGGVSRGLNTFKDEYAGNAITGSLENTLQGLSSSFGSEGQRDWWAQFGSTDNVIRNDLFGATLTDSEKAAYAATTVSPSMDPKEVKKNLESRRTILEAALKRRTNFLKAQGYSKEAIEALAGEYADRLGASIVAPKEPPAPGATANDVGNETEEAKRKLLVDGGDIGDTLAGGRKYEDGDYVSAAKQPDGTWEAVYPDGSKRKFPDAPPLAVNVSGDIEDDPELAKARESGMGQVDAIVRGAADTVSFGLMDELSAGTDWLQGRGSFRDLLDQQRAIDSYDAENSPWLRGAGQLAGAVALPIGTGAKTVKELAGVGGAMGGAYGFGSGDSLEDRTIGALTGAASGALIGTAFGTLGNAIRNRRPPTPPPGVGNAVGRDAASAASDLGMDVLPADVGGPIVGRATAGAVQTPYGIGPIAKKSAAIAEQGKGVRDRAASAYVDPSDAYGAGQAAKGGLTSWIKSSETRGGRLYDAVSVPSEENAVTTSTVSALKDVLNGMDSNPEMSRIWTGYPRLRATLEALRRPNVRQRSGPAGYPMLEKEIADGQWVPMTQREIDAGSPEGGKLSWQDMKRLRSIVGEIVGSPSLSSEGAENSAMRKFYAGLSEDMRATAEKSGPKALREFERANSYWRARENRIKNVVEPILGKGMDKGGQSAFNQIQNWAATKGETTKLAQMMRSLPDDEADIVSATIISKLGRETAGRQGAKNDNFSLGTFLTDWSKLDPRAKNALFRPSQREALEKLAKVAEGSKQAQRYANTSNTAGAELANKTNAGLVSAAGALATGNLILGAILASPAAGQYITGRILASPKLVNWLLREPRNPGAAKAHIEKLGRIVIKDPALAAETMQLRNFLLRAMNDNAPTRSVASEGSQEDRER